MTQRIKVAATQERHRALDAPPHQIRIGRFAIGELELAAEVPGGHIHAAGERVDVQRLCILAVHPVPSAPQQLEGS
ncbi:hypothetical protein LAUMK35_04141 [Mycobacterium pseudokansasii]|uniref:Uncharacterized protein n=1 Tax=Mycobacterium pseudokansasii TaxID=2341080 RepID=A0A498QVA9_9MYCO|nr:hypothetical protein A4G27_05795 [Mycobacterium kansasii]VAZ98768.1 hypothetical protein LAUMK35_04141 [Mycobacterium pseudokansasii]VBA29970.1 hypothetical protein LAUMK21_04137 [Mycobacterium pseudokansasii]VBA53394.1 hypothetical protein LAUMK142_04028 [Mycobacterium pseudokansasii]